MELLLETICSTGIRVFEVAYITIEAARSGKTEIRMKGKIRTILLPKKFSTIHLMQIMKTPKPILFPQVIKYSPTMIGTLLFPVMEPAINRMKSPPLNSCPLR